MPLGFVVENDHDAEENSELADTNAIAGDGFRPNFKFELPGKINKGVLVAAVMLLRAGAS